VDGGTLHVAATTVGRIDAFNTSTLAPTGSLGGGSLVKPNTLVKAGGRLWTSTGTCGARPQLASINPITGVTTVHASGGGLFYCPFLFTSPIDPNMVLGFDIGLSPTTVYRYDVSTGAPVIDDSFWAGSNSNSRDAKVLPDGQTFALASGSPYEIRTLGVDPLNYNGVVYTTGNYPNAVDATAASGGGRLLPRHAARPPDPPRPVAQLLGPVDRRPAGRQPAGVGPGVRPAARHHPALPMRRVPLRRHR